jgi:RNA polymerase sigma factor (sigma-70 family)
MAKDRGPSSELESCVAAAKAGDRAAFGILIALTQNRVFRFCLYLTGTRESAEELMQETYIKVFQKLTYLDKNAAIWDWIFRIAKNHFLDQVRSSPAGTGTSMIELNPVVLDQAAAAGDADAEKVHAVRALLSQFEPEDRLLLILVDIEGHSYGAAGTILGISESAVKSRVYRLRQEFIAKWKKA